MTPNDHIRMVGACLQAAEQMISSGENLLASEMFWGAAIHSVNAVAMQRGWDHGKYSHKSDAVARLADQYEDSVLTGGFWAARHRLHPNFDKGFLTESQFNDYCQDVQHFVDRMLEIAKAGGEYG